MGKRGPPPLPDEVKDLRGTLQPCRSHPNVVAKVTGDLVKPKWLTVLASEIWEEKIPVYVARGMNIVGCETTIAHYCEMDAAARLIWMSGGIPSSAMMMALKTFMIQFYDTPASQLAANVGEAKSQQDEDNPWNTFSVIDGGKRKAG